MNNDFPRIIIFLRKEKGLTQKQAASELGISQALLSHYEKGIRECGLDFLIKIADYYDVSTDYLLGRTLQKKPSAVGSTSDHDKQSRPQTTMINQINCRLINDTTNVIFDLLRKIGNKRLTNIVSTYLMCSDYQIFRTLYSSDTSNAQNVFSLDHTRYRNLTTASMMIDLEAMDAIISGGKLSLTLSPDVISAYFEKDAPSLFNLIQLSERNVKNFVSQK